MDAELWTWDRQTNRQTEIASLHNAPYCKWGHNNAAVSTFSVG